MKIFQKHIGWIYLKYFLIVFIALELFFVGIDVLSNLVNLPKSANLIVLYMIFSASLALSLILPLSVVLAFIVCSIQIIRSGELVAFFALGISKNKLVMPVFIVSCFLTLIYVAIQSTPLAYAKDLRRDLGSLKYDGSKYDLNAAFLKFENKFIYFIDENPGTSGNKKLRARVFELENNQITRKILAYDVEFKAGSWIAKNADIIALPKDPSLGGSGYEVLKTTDYEVLKGFEPELLSNLNKNASSYSVLHALRALWQVKDEQINLSVVKTALYLGVVFPFFAPFMIIIIYNYMPLMARFSSLALVSFVCVIATLCVWGVGYVLSRLASSGTISPELGVLLPVALLGLFAFRKFKLAR